MKSVEEIKSFIEQKKSVNPEKKLPDDFNIYDWSGGNFDDAYSLGIDRGYAHGINDLANAILEFIVAGDKS